MAKKEGGAAVDGAVMTRAELTEKSIQAGRERRDDMARWLAVEVLMSDPVACEDTGLLNGLSRLQDKIEAGLRAAVGA